MKARLASALVASAFALTACGDDDASGPGASGGATAGEAPDSAGESSGGTTLGGSGPEGGSPDVAGSAGAPEPGGPGGAGGAEPDSWYACQGTEQAFVRRAILGVLGRRPYSQAEVNLYVDVINAVDELDGVTAADKLNPPGSDLRRSRKLVLRALFAQPDYVDNWQELYRDIIKVQRIEEQYNAGCFATPLAPDAVAAARYVRDNPPTAEGASPFSMYDVIKGSIALDDVTPIFTANLFAMMTKTYLGANALPVALELTRRRDFGAWFDAVYLHRDVVCLGCHNSEFSVTQSADPLKNRHFPLGPLLEKSLFGASTGPSARGGYPGGDRMHAPLRFNGFVNDCDPTPHTQEEAEQVFYNPGCASPEEPVYFCLAEVICSSDFPARGVSTPWSLTEECGRFQDPAKVKVDIAGVEAQFGSVKGLKTTVWDLAPALRAGFEKLRVGGLGVDAAGEVADPDEAFAYLTSMTIAEKVWLQVVGTPLTIPTRFPRNAAARNQLQVLTEAFIGSGFSNRALLEAVLASPYANMASPNAGCGDDAYAAPAVFDPWVIAEEDPIKRKNSAVDAVVSLPARTATQAFYKALGWQLPSTSFPDLYWTDPEDPALPFLESERQFQAEVGFYLKNAEPGFRGFDFQARLGWENRFATCTKLPYVIGPDFIDELVAGITPLTTLEDLVRALKDRMVGGGHLDQALEVPALEALLGSGLDTLASESEQPELALRRACGVIASSPQFLLNGIPPEDTSEVPALTPVSASYVTVCAELQQAQPFDGLLVACPADQPISLTPR